MTPDREGWWKHPEYGEVEIYSIDFAGGGLWAWCDDVGVCGGVDEQVFTDGDEISGHIPASVIGDGWEFFREFGEQEKQQS